MPETDLPSPNATARSIGHHFISYSAADAADFAPRLADALQKGQPRLRAWLDKRELIPGRDWDEQLAEAIRGCDSLIFVMTPDSVDPLSTCKLEWTRALKYKKPIIPLLFKRGAELPFRLEPRQYIDFTGAFAPAVKKLRQHLVWLATPAGQLQALKDRLADANRDLRRADAGERLRIQAEIDELKNQVATQEQLVLDPQGAAQRTAQTIASGLERERQPEKPVAGARLSKFINPPPLVAPTYFQDRYVENKLIAGFLQDDARCMLTIVGRAGTGKTALACRALKALERGALPDDLGPLSVDGIVYLSAVGLRRLTLPNLWADLCRLLPGEQAAQFDALYKEPRAATVDKMAALLAAFPPGGRVVALLDNFEDALDADTQALRDPELNEALHALLNAPPHALKLIVTTRVVPRELALVQPGRQTCVKLDEGLESPFAENILREMDADGKLGLKTAPPELLAEARAYTRGYPRALEALFALISADRYTTLREVLDSPPPANVVEALVGQAFDRLDPAAQKIMQALAVYNRPATPASLDFLLQPYLPSVDSTPVLNRLVNMHFARREAGRYSLHPVDRDYAFGRVPAGEEADRERAEVDLLAKDKLIASPKGRVIPQPLVSGFPVWSQFALLHRGAEYYKQTRKPREQWKTIDDLAPQLAEFDLRCAAQEYDTAARVLREIDFNYLLLWGFYHLLVEMYVHLRGKLSDPDLISMSLNELGSAYYFLGQTQQAISYYEQALAFARKIRNRDEESVYLGNLGNGYSQLGQTARAIAYYEQALAIARELGDTHREGIQLGNLGNRFSELGQTVRAIAYYEQALAIRRGIGDRLGEGIDLGNLAETLIDDGRYTEAIARALESAKIGEEIKRSRSGSFSNGRIALAHLLSGSLPAARNAAETARRYDEPTHNPYILALLGVIALRQGDYSAACEALSAAIAQADGLLSQTAQNFDALDSKALALCGLALCPPDAVAANERLSQSIAAFAAARAINRDAGVVGRVLRLLDAMAPVDPNGLLAEVRKAAAGG